MSGEPVQLLVANLGCLGFHSWPIRAHQPNVTDELGITTVPASDAAAGVGDAPWPPQYPTMAGEPSRVAASRAKKTASPSDIDSVEQGSVTPVRSAAT